MTRKVYLDHAATTPVHPKVVEAMLPYFTEKFGNPSAAYWLGQEAHEAITRSRAVVADVLGCAPKEIVFTSGATESINNALKGVAFASSDASGNHIITSSVEHHAVLETCKFLKRFGFEVTFLPVDHTGLVDPLDVGRAITPRTILVSVMLANNEVGTIEPVAEIGKVVRERSQKLGRKIVFHTDAVQAAEWLDLNVDALGVDMLSLSAHKFFGPKGVGILYLRRGTPFLTQQCGGAQEDGRRAGTENVAGIVGLGEALRLAVEYRDSNAAHCRRLRDRFIKEVEARIPDVQLTGHRTQRLPNNASFCFKHIDGGAILLHLDFLGVAASSGSACSTGSTEPSHVLISMGIPAEVARGSVRFSFGPGNTDDDVDYTLSVLPDVVARLRAISPFGRPVSK
ncbi:MAG: cysteine desulfurase [Dehalococcoidia bacterium]|nr:cysteine desulfurase [Dehalococcoidia bacterium]